MIRTNHYHPNGIDDLAPTKLLEEYEENGKIIRRFAPGWARGVEPELTL